MEVLTKKISYREYREMDFADEQNALFELLNGEIVARNSPSQSHQTIVLSIAGEIRNFLKTSQLGRVFVAPLDVVLDNINAPQPDVLFVKKDRYFVLENEDKVVHGAPDLVVEVISPTSIRRDRFQKLKIYEQFAIREYWLVDPTNKTVEVFQMRENRYELVAFADQTGQIQSAVLEGFELDVSQVF